MQTIASLVKRLDMTAEEALGKLQYMLFEVDSIDAEISDEQCDLLIDVDDDPALAETARQAKLNEREKARKRAERLQAAAKKAAAKKAAAAKKEAAAAAKKDLARLRSLIPEDVRLLIGIMDPREAGRPAAGNFAKGRYLDDVWVFHLDELDVQPKLFCCPSQDLAVAQKHETRGLSQCAVCNRLDRHLRPHAQRVAHGDGKELSICVYLTHAIGGSSWLWVPSP